ncbi:hypothetical protein RclHR1_05180013 [Rhizophagus clarus]|uniref:Uncharacterized protein n=1 Tax=Rhizophagus clarus TaxID=94130 RepID=A0A2Z6RL58_9GLOM|nr:hypothetical protein RclHR1_05180013 [Rhizophagus clarus]
MTCNTRTNPPDTDFVHYPCQPRETCIQFYVAAPNPNQDPIPHAYCIANEKCREWDNHNNPYADTCSYTAGYRSGPTPVDIEIAFIVYDHNNLPIQGKGIQYCFDTATRNVVTAHAAAQKLSLLSDPGTAEFLEPL